MSSEREPTLAGPCPEREEALSLYVDGDLDVAERDGLEAHLSRCPGCAAELEALREMTGALRDLGRATPPPELFESVTVAVDRHGRRSFWIGTGAVAVAAVLVVVGVLVTRRPPSPAVGPHVVAPLSVRASAEAEFHKAETHYRNAIGMLRSLAEVEKPLWSWKRRRAFEADLQVLDSAIEESRKLRRTAPADSALQDLVFASYRAQIDYLRDTLSPRSDDSI